MVYQYTLGVKAPQSTPTLSSAILLSTYHEIENGEGNTGAAGGVLHLPHREIDRHLDAGLDPSIPVHRWIPPKSNRREPWEYDRELYKRRNLIERAFNKLKQWRRIATRYDRRSIYLLSALYLVSSVIWG